MAVARHILRLLAFWSLKRLFQKRTTLARDQGPQLPQPVAPEVLRLTSEQTDTGDGGNEQDSSGDRVVLAEHGRGESGCPLGLGVSSPKGCGTHSNPLPGKQPCVSLMV